MKKIGLLKIVAAIAILIGGGWLSFSIIIPVYELIINFNPGDLIVMFVFLPLVSLPGAIALYYGVRLLKEKNEFNIKRTVGTLIFCIAFMIYLVIGTHIEKMVQEQGLSFLRIYHVLFVFMFSLTVIPVYVFISRYVLIKEGFSPKRNEYVSKGMLMIVSTVIWGSCSGLVDAFSPIIEGYFNIKEFHWEMTMFFGPVIFAWIYYLTAKKLLGLSSRKRSIESPQE